MILLFLMSEDVGPRRTGKSFLPRQVGISQREAFGPAKRIIGPKGYNMKLIADMVPGAKLRLKGNEIWKRDSPTLRVDLTRNCDTL